MNYQDVIEHFICGRALHAGEDHCIVVETAYPATGSIRTLLYKSHLYAERFEQVTMITIHPNMPVREVVRRINYLTSKLQVQGHMFHVAFNPNTVKHTAIFSMPGVATQRITTPFQLVIPDGLTTPDEIIAYNMMIGNMMTGVQQ